MWECSINSFSEEAMLADVKDFGFHEVSAGWQDEIKAGSVLCDDGAFGAKTDGQPIAGLRRLVLDLVGKPAH